MPDPANPSPSGPQPTGPDPEARLAELGIQLPTPPSPVAAYIPSVRAGNLVFVSGQVPLVDGKPLATGRVPSEVDLDLAIQCARQCTLNALAVVKAQLGSLAAVKQIVRVGCFVACDQGFSDHPKVANGCSKLLVDIFGDRGRHARAAVGAPSLPLGVPVEIEMIVEAGG
jgi:enamine deaminase RidA (YjgF/YER057c/UK114 family)